MKTTIYALFSRLLAVSLLFSLTACPQKEEDPIPKPSAFFTYTPTTNLVAPVTLYFSNGSKNATSYRWETSDGQTSTAEEVTLTIRSGGSITIKLTATGAGGSATYSRTITVADPPPTQIIAGFTYSPSTNLVAPATVTFTNTSVNATSYKWDFDDGTTSTTASPSKTFATDKTYTVKLTATNASGSAETSKSIVVAKALAAKPTADFSYSPSTNLVAPATITFTNTSTNATSYKWDFSDGTTSTTVSPSKTFATDGTYTVKLTATGAGGSTETSKSIVVSKAVAATGRVVFWTDQSSGWSSIDVTVGGTAAGSFNTYNTSAPACGGNSGLTVTKTPGTYTLSARSNTGATWSDNITIAANNCLQYQLKFAPTNCDWVTYSTSTALGVETKWGFCGADGLSIKVTNKTNIKLHCYFCIEQKKGGWDCGASTISAGSYDTYWSCANTGQTKVWAISSDVFNKNNCSYPKP